MINRLRAAFYWTKGKFFFEEDNVVEALDYFRKAEKCSAEPFCDLYAHIGRCELLLSDVENSIVSNQYALSLIDSTKNYNKDEKNYMKKYVLENLVLGLRHLNQTQNLKEYESMLQSIDYDEGNIKESMFFEFILWGRKGFEFE